MFAAAIAGYMTKSGADLVPRTYNFFASKSQLSDKRKKTIEERRAQLKIDEGDTPVMKIIIDELLAYKPNAFTLDDRYLQLEQILDAIDKAKVNKQSDHLVAVCEKIAEHMTLSPGTFKNAFLERLQSAILRIQETEDCQLRSKL